MQYADFAIWQRSWLQGEALDTQLRYWEDQLRDAATLELPTDRARPDATELPGRQPHFLVGSRTDTSGCKRLAGAKVRRCS